MTPSVEPIPIQLCIQGGAAKIALLTAFMEAVQELHDKDLRVTNVAGTSAGAIVGTLFAAGVPMSTVRNRLGTVPLEKIVPQKGKIRTGLALARGIPLWSEDELRSFLTSLLDESILIKDENPPRQLATFDDILRHRGIKIQVMATNLTDGMSIIRKGGDPIISSLLDSAAIPFFFRALGSSVVDGGLCENLPTELLSDNENEGAIIAISFLQKAGTPPRNLVEYCLAVVGAGIDHSANRSRRLLEERAKRLSLPHDVFPINSPIESFDFEKAIHDGLAENYETVLKAARAWLTTFVEKRRRQIAENAVLEERARGQQTIILRETEYYRRDVPRNLGRMYKAQHQPITLRWIYARLEVTVSPTHSSPDALNHLAEFYTRDQAVWCYRLPILVAQQTSAIVQPGWRVFGPDKNLIPYYHMVMDEDGDPKTLEWLVCFETPLPPETGPYSLVLTEPVHDFMRRLRNNKRDDLWISFHRKHGLVAKMEVIAHVPETMPRVDLQPMPGAGNAVQIEAFEFIPNRRPGYNPYGFRGTGISSDCWGMYLNPV